MGEGGLRADDEPERLWPNGLLGLCVHSAHETCDKSACDESAHGESVPQLTGSCLPELEIRQNVDYAEHCVDYTTFGPGKLKVFAQNRALKVRSDLELSDS